ncbi:peptidoglycan-binding protein [Nakamurella aerolata]|uniref:Peptidoglycan hydrolase-like protein with peptidoglycan-binding domain n=1 Tax=Nakamurella aerolata TaxID=1656892 RepID=A0A849AAY9_9ACTN|nr:peptidoglycan-binding protein [Nakamurella aerolata]NNG36746.1 hypothetical protein [Nakamurella aerolata]
MNVRKTVTAAVAATCLAVGGGATAATVSNTSAPAKLTVGTQTATQPATQNAAGDPLFAADRSRFWVSASSPYSNIRALQFLMNAYGISVSSTGKYDTATKNAVIKFQRAKGLEQDGSAGPITMRAMVGGANTAARYRWPNRNTTKAVQQLLIKFGYNQVADGDFGPVTRMNTINFQKAKGLPQTGIVDYVTWTYLFNPPPPPSGSKQWIPLSQLTSGYYARANCGPTATVMGVLALGKTPVKFTRADGGAAAIDYMRRYTFGHNAWGATSYEEISKGFKAYGFKTSISWGKTEPVLAAVRAGKVAVLNGNERAASWPNYGGGGHYIVLVGYSNGMYKMMDPVGKPPQVFSVTGTQLTKWAAANGSLRGGVIAWK